VENVLGAACSWVPLRAPEVSARHRRCTQIYRYIHTQTYRQRLSWKICVRSQIRHNLHMNVCRKWVAEKYLRSQRHSTVRWWWGGCIFLLWIPAVRQWFLVLCYPPRSSRVLWHPVSPHCSPVSALSLTHCPAGGFPLRPEP